MRVKEIFKKGAEKAQSTAIWAVRAYRKNISPLLGSSCRFSPTCSQYAEDALVRYGVIGGTRRALWRILRCNPFSRGGYDPVEKDSGKKEEV